MAEYLAIELCELCELYQRDKMKIFSNEALFDRALEAVITNLRTMKESV